MAAGSTSLLLLVAGLAQNIRRALGFARSFGEIPLPLAQSSDAFCRHSAADSFFIFSSKDPHHVQSTLLFGTASPRFFAIE